MSKALISIDQLLAYIKNNIDLNQKTLYNTVLNQVEQLRDKLQVSATQTIPRRSYWESMMNEAQKLEQYVIHITKTYGKLEVDDNVLDLITQLINNIDDYLKQVGETASSTLKLQDHNRQIDKDSTRMSESQFQSAMDKGLKAFSQDLQQNYLNHLVKDIQLLSNKIKECKDQNEEQNDQIRQVFEFLTKLDTNIQKIDNEIVNIKQQIVDVKKNGQQNKGFQQLHADNQMLREQITMLENKLLKVERSMEMHSIEPVRTQQYQVPQNFNEVSVQNSQFRRFASYDQHPSVESMSDCLNNRDTKRTRK